MKTCWLAVLCAAVVALSNAGDSCPDVKIIGVGDSDRLSILRGCPGSPGSSGQKGDPGDKGESGPSGSMGKMGPTGQKGEPGPSGSIGKMGPTGQKGESGPSGSIGKEGPTGQKGESGPSGSIGKEGPTGQKGEPGALGIREEHRAKNCKELQERGVVLSDWYIIFPDGKTPLTVLCDLHTDGGGWIVFQRRSDGSVDFFRDWNSYKIGFGNRMNEFWLGNENLHKITSSGSWTLRIDFQDVEYNNYFAKYASFKVLAESQKYKLLLGAFSSGDAGDSMNYHNTEMFSTKDQDNDNDKYDCAKAFMGGWWYYKCHTANLNGLYLHGSYNRTRYDGIVWKTGKGFTYSYKFTEMKIRPNQ